MAWISPERQKKQREDRVLLRGYNLWRQEWYTKTLALCPPEMVKILRYVREMPDSAEDDFLERIQKLEWLMTGHPDIRFMLLRVIARRMEDKYGLNDPLPPETNMFFKAREILNVR